MIYRTAEIVLDYESSDRVAIFDVAFPWPRSPIVTDEKSEEVPFDE